MTQQEDVETVKRAADRQSERELGHPANQVGPADGFIENLPECCCVAPDLHRIKGVIVQPAYCLNCGCRGKVAAGRKVEGDIVTRGIEVDESLEAAKRFVSGGSVDAFLAGTAHSMQVGDNLIVNEAFDDGEPEWTSEAKSIMPEEYNAVSPPHYQRGPRVRLDGYDTAEFYDIQAIDVMRCIQDPRLATAFKYIWRVAFGGKSEPWDSRSSAEVDARDISSAKWYLEDYLANPPETLDRSGPGAYTPGAIGRSEPKD